MNVLKEVAEDNADCEIKVGVLQFSSGAKWVTKNGLVSMEDFYWNNLEAFGVTDLGMALDELNEKMSRSSFLVSDTGFALPVFIFLSDGGPTDNWHKAFEKISTQNRWFKEGRKIAIAIGDEADKDVLKELADEGSVVEAKDLEKLKSLIVAVSASASLLAGQSRMVGDEAKGADILKDAQDKLNSDSDDADDWGDTQPQADVDDTSDDDDTADSGDSGNGSGSGGWDDDDDDWN